MASINGYTAEKMKAIADAAIKAVAVVGGHLIITHEDNSQTDAGNVVGPQGEPGVQDLDLYDPIGVPKPLLIPGVPDGYGVCDGTTEYVAGEAPILAAAWGTGPACVNGPAAVGNIKLPDLRGQSIFGLHPGIPAFDALLKTGGSKDAVVVSHDHGATADQAPHGHGADVHNGGVDHYHGTGNAGYHSHGVGGDSWDSDRIVFTMGAGQTTGLVAGDGALGVTYTHIDPVGDHNHGNTGWATAYVHDHGITIDTADPGITVDVLHEGVSGVDKNLPPYRVANWIMRLG